MDKKNVEGDVLQKIQGLKSLFKFGGEIVPFIEELFLFIQDVLPLMDKISNYIGETTKSMPKAQDRIAKANKETEAATAKIMDKLDVMGQRLEEMSAQIESSGNDEKLQSLIQDVQNDSSEIVFALQFQDITAQQLEHAQKMLHVIYTKFNQLFQTIDRLEIDDSLKKIFFGNIMQPDEDKDVITRASEDLIRNEGISQDDIDKLFSS